MRWRDVKKGKFQKLEDEEELTPKAAPLVLRFKAWIIDVFMIYIPILYITTYFILDGKDAFQSNQFAIFIDTALFGVILALFWTKKGQSPGLKAYELKLIDLKDEKSPSFLKSLWRYFLFLIAGVSIVGLCLGFFRKDRKNLHDLLSKTVVIR